MAHDLMRFSVAMPENLLERFDALVAKRGLAKNRSEVVRDLVRDALIEEECTIPGKEVMGTLTIVFDHHAGDVREKLDSIQHEYFGMVIIWICTPAWRSSSCAAKARRCRTSLT